MTTEAQIKEALKPFLFKKITPNLLDKVLEALEPVVEEIVARKAAEFEVIASKGTTPKRTSELDA